MKKHASLVILLLSCLTPSGLIAANVNLQKLIAETQWIEQSHGYFRLLWWIPTEYWQETLRENPGITQAQKEALYDAVDDYIVLAVIDAKMTALGSVMPRPREEIVAGMALTISGREQPLKPLPENGLSPDATNLFALMKPLMANMLGQFGKGMQFICFDGRDKQGRRLLDPKERADFEVALAGSTHKWRLPLGSLLDPKYDADTGEEFPGNYLYSPFTGKKLIDKALERTAAPGGSSD